MHHFVTVPGNPPSRPIEVSKKCVRHEALSLEEWFRVNFDPRYYGYMTEILDGK
jgi:hypothetical protein